MSLLKPWPTLAVGIVLGMFVAPRVVAMVKR